MGAPRMAVELASWDLTGLGHSRLSGALLWTALLLSSCDEASSSGAPATGAGGQADAGNTGGGGAAGSAGGTAGTGGTTTCVDGTEDGQCVADRTGNDDERPWRCVGGILAEDNAVCGCPAGLHPWRDGGCTVHGHVRLFNFDLKYENPEVDDISFKASHFDDVFAHHAHIGEVRAANPALRIFVYRNYSALTDEEITTAIPDFCAEQTGPCDVEDMILHFKTDSEELCDTVGACTAVPGWDPDWQPGDPPATGTTRSESRVPDWWLLEWKSANYVDPGWLAYQNDKVLNNVQGPSGRVDGVLTDNGDFYPPGTQYDRTWEYWQAPLDESHPRIRQSFDVQTDLRDYLTTSVGRQIEVVPNARAPYWYFHDFFHDGYRAMNVPIHIEVWTAFTALDSPQGGSPRALHYDIDYERSLSILAEAREGRRFYLQGLDVDGSDRPRAQLFLLAYYYLLNRQGLAFGFRDSALMGQAMAPPDLPLEAYSWIPAMAFDIGTPVTNPSALPDAFGEMGTTEHYELTSGVDPSTPNSLTGGETRDYHLLARNYTSAWVLVKFRVYGGLQNNSSATTHELGGSYWRLRADGSLESEAITQVTLRGNEAAILVPAS